MEQGSVFSAAALLISEEGGVLRPTFGIDLATAGPAPRCEFIRVEGQFPDCVLADVAPGQLASDISKEGCVIRGRLVIADSFEPHEVLFAWPKHGGDGIWHAAGCSLPRIDRENVTEGGIAGESGRASHQRQDAA